MPALLAMMWLIGKVLRDFSASLRKSRLAPEAVYFVHGAIAAILALLVEGLFEYNLGDSEVLTMFLIVVSGGYLAIKSMSSSEAAQYRSARGEL